MNLTFTNIAATVLWCAAAGIVVWFLLVPVRRRSLTGLLVALVLTGAAASAGALLGAIRSMLVPGLHWPEMLILTLVSGAVTTVAAIAVARRLARDNAVLVRSVTELGAGRIPVQDGKRLTAEVERVHQEVRVTAAALEATRQRERALETARRDLVSWVSHDLRTPLAGLRAMAEALEDGVAEDPDAYYKQIGLAVERLNRMVEDLFDLSRIQSGHRPRATEPVALDDVVSDSLAALEPLAVARGVRLVSSLGSRVTISGNSSELNRMTTNLVANAIRHTPVHGSVVVRVDVDGESGTHACVTVEDQCGGIDEAHLDRVFDVGFRGESARTPSGDSAGAGLGLAITRGVVEAHGGSVDVANHGDGCRFRARLPLAR